MTVDQRLSLAEHFLAQGRHAACLRIVAADTDRAPRTRHELAAQRLLAQAAYGLGRLAPAEQAARRVLARRPKDQPMMRLLVRVLQRQGRHRDAADWMTRLDELGTDTWDDPTPDVKPSRPARRHRAA